MDNFELLFSKINGKPEYAKLQRILEPEVRDYFKSLKLPDEPTIYDYLILSLTEKDAIITFNWDSFFNAGMQKEFIYRKFGTINISTR